MKNLLKSWFTTLIGIIILIITTYNIFIGTIFWVWEGIAGITIGCTLLFVPRTFEKLFEKILEKFTPKQ